MKALTTAGRPGLTLQNVPEPDTPTGHVKVRVLRAGICGTDLHIHHWDAWAEGAVTPGITVGHEFCGEIVELGQGVEGLAVGDLMSAEGHIVCGQCRNCRAGRRHLCINTSNLGVGRNGGFAEFVTVPASNVWVHQGKSLASVTDAELDVFGIYDPLGNAVHTALKFPLVGEDVVITGAGPIGLMAAAVVRMVGARHVLLTDIAPHRLELARSMGFTAIDPRERSIRDTQSDFGMREGFDVALEMSGAPTALPELVDNMNAGGRIAMLGLPASDISIDWGSVVSRMLTIQGIYGREMYETWYAMTQLIASGLDVSPVITHRFAFDDWEDAFATAQSGEASKVILDFE
ncbi:MAG TPA: L-threonine 3-dehydrogenase [Candidatus Agrococcus pullicola]|uniref:L-threonine 3-dehydrogenase n=1 Tax=Candidatus Agrococcus pullicola TaxID=2838429 RepID=A0A9D1YX33_9MICO|nr:L-threonine 3-dehydrogenase [Candidatus Agrococcus pullicola]